MDPDSKLLEKMRLGDSAAFEQLFLLYYNQVYRVVYGLVGSREAAEDLSQETFLELYKAVPSIPEGATLIAWLCRVALNKGYNNLRGEKRALQRLERFSGQAEADPDADLVRAEERARVREVLDKLPERQSKLLLLRHAGLTLAEIAAVINVAPGSVGTLLARAEKAFAAAYTIMNPTERGSLEKRQI